MSKINYQEAIFQQEIDAIAQHLQEAIQEQKLPWQKGWESDYSFAYNAYTGHIYSGKNEELLLLKTLTHHYPTPAFMTFKNVCDLGGSVKKGEKSHKILYFNSRKPTPQEAQALIQNIQTHRKSKLSSAEVLQIQETPRKFVRVFSVFNLAQCHLDPLLLQKHQNQAGIPQGLQAQQILKEKRTIPMVESILKNSQVAFQTNPMGQAFYHPQKDYISLPPQENFKDIHSFYATALHELGHSTGHPQRLNRFKNSTLDFGSPEYAKEELCAELFSFLQGQKLALPFDFSQHTSYLKDWLQYSKEGIKTALKEAFQIADFVETHWYPKLQQELTLQKNLSTPKKTRSL